MMKKLLAIIVVFTGGIYFTACNTATPQKYFDVAVLNTNIIAGFAGNGQLRQLESPAATITADGQTVARKSTEELQFKIDFAEASFAKLKDLKETADANDILQSAKALYELVIPVFKTDYYELAALYDKGAAQEIIAAKAKDIHDKYYNRYEALYNTLINHGKAYAKKHNIQVHWADEPQS